MAKAIIIAKNFSKRTDLEDYVKQTFGDSTEKKDAEIQGTTEELAKLRLSGSTTIYGVSCKATDAKPPEPLNRVNRGKQSNFGIEGQSTNKNPNL